MAHLPTISRCCYSFGEGPRLEGAGRIAAQSDLEATVIAFDDQRR
jgi:hypothetical protein